MAALQRYLTAGFSYPEVGATRAGDLPAGYEYVHRWVRLGTGPDVFRAAADALRTWRMHEAAGLRIQASAAAAAPGVTVVQGVGLGRLRAWMPCRVVWTVAEPTVCGFAYGTLAGHQECGEERFLVELAGDGRVSFSVAAFSRPRGLLARLGGPLTRRVQLLFVSRYIAALRTLATPRPSRS